MAPNLIKFLEKNENTRKIFGVRELKIIEKQLWGIKLKQSEKNRLSRDIRKKFEFIKDICEHSFDLRLKKGQLTLDLIEDAKEVILQHEFFPRIKKIILFGSFVENEFSSRSDIDIAVEFDKITKTESFDFRRRIMGQLDDKFDIQVMNFLPQKIKKSILKNHKIIYQHGNHQTKKRR